MHIVFLNLSDRAGASAKSIRALRLKYPAYSGRNLWRWLTNNNYVDEVNLIDLWSADRENWRFWAEVLRVNMLCSIADKIMLSIHGHADDTTCGYIERFGMASRRVNFRDLAQFLLLFLPNQSDCYHLALITCHAARSENYLKDHDGNLTRRDVKSSFAYRFYREICTQRNVLMTARTGSVSFSEHSGRSLVQSEAGVRAEVELQTLEESTQLERLRDIYEKFMEIEFQKVGNIRRFRATEEKIRQEIVKGRTDWSMASREETAIILYQQARRRITELQRLKDDDHGKYGKFIYRYEPTTSVMTVLRKYPTPSEVLYQGGL